MLQWCTHSDYKCARQTAYTLVNHSLNRVLRKCEVFKVLKLWDWLAYSGRTRAKIRSLAKNQPIALMTPYKSFKNWLGSVTFMIQAYIGSEIFHLVLSGYANQPIISQI